jgi:hypothetical protein
MDWVTCERIYSHFFLADEIFFKGPCWLLSVAMNTTSAGVGRVRIYDGTDTNGDVIFELQCPADNHKHLKFSYPVYLRHGLYLNNVQNMRAGFVQLLPIDR